ncbi:MAG: purple acid phosphatase [Chthonomonadales bacterium]|nr:purple acid phosphatase [Chthonomonadales bacterium]
MRNRTLTAAALLFLCAPAARLAAAPTQVRLSWTGDPRMTMTVMWQTTEPEPGSIVRYGLDARLSSTAVASSPTYAYQTGHLHEATMRGLRPGAVYRYRVGSPSGGFSPVYRFRTAPPGPVDFEFTAFGDHGVTARSRRNASRVLAAHPAFHLVLGDLSYANGRQPVWDTWLSEISVFACSLPMMTVIGNHENERIDGERIGYVAYLARLAMPTPETWYAFTYGDVRFVCPNSNDIDNATQRAWLERTLSAARRDPGIRWVVVAMHHPLYSSTTRRGDSPDMIKALEGLLDRHRVDLVLVGHNHNYERSYPLRGGEPRTAERHTYRQGEGIIHVISGGGGKSLYEFTPEQPARIAVRARVTEFLRVRVLASGSLTLEAVRTADGSVLDRFTLVRRAARTTPSAATRDGQLASGAR